MSEPIDRLDTDKDQQKIGRDGCAVRTLTFAGGGFDTVMQLGVIHALLVIRGKAPDAVVGVSAGAVNAAALAEVLQAGAKLDQRDGWEKLTDEQKDHRILEARVERFREIFDAYKRAPNDIVDDLLPDMFQVEAQRPLEPIQQPIHDQRERDSRREAMESRAGLINLYNELLKVRVYFSTLTLAIRRWLGLKASAEVRSRAGRWLATTAELARSWLHVGRNINRIAPLLPPLLVPFFKTEGRRPKGATAARLIFRWPLLRWLKESLSHVLWTVLLFVAWIAITFLILGLPVIGLWFVLMDGGIARPVLSGLVLYALLLLAVLLLVERARARGNKFGPSLRSWLEARWTSLKSLASRMRLSLETPRSPALVAGVLFAVWIAISVLVFRREPTESVVKVAGIVMLIIHGFLLATVVVCLYCDRAWFSRSRSWHLLGFAGASIWALVTLLLPWAVAVGAGAVLVWRLDPDALGDPLVLSLRYLANGLWLIAILIGALGVWLFLSDRRKTYVRHLLARYHLAESLFHPHALRQFFVSLFDRDYYGQARLDDVVERTLGDDPSPREKASSDELSGDCTPRAAKPPKLVGGYARGKPKIHVGLTVADVESGKLTVVEDNAKVVDGLLAAMAVTPWFPPQRIGAKRYLDGTNIANEPTRALLELLRDRINPESTVVHIYSVASLPFTRASLGKERDSYLSLVDVVLRSRRLRRFRDAILERRLTEVFARAIPRGKAVYTGKSGETYVRAWVTAVEPDVPITLHEHILGVPEDERQTLLTETVADGCRAALEVMIRPSLGNEHREGRTPCRMAVKYHLESRARKAGKDPTGYAHELPGSSIESGPGLREICDKCALNRKTNPPENPQWLRIHSWGTMGPAWPHENEENEPELKSEADVEDPDPHFTRPPPTINTLDVLQQHYQLCRTLPEGRWPRPRTAQTDPEGPSDKQTVPGNKRPLVSLLFSGGVFRGVFQMGVLNALSQVNIKPDLIAGASVGSITAAMVATAFEADYETQDREGRIARLAAAYLALDRLILTDRFADFIRYLTLRGAESHFSIRQADRLFRKYDSASAGRFNRESRRVIAGLERLLYVSPFELKELVEASRNRQTDEIVRLLRKFGREWLARMRVSDQVLGAEPLARLVREHVTHRLPPGVAGHSVDAPFDVFRDAAGIYFLATTTNLTLGNLQILGESPNVPGGAPVTATLLEGLLASSAFPGVFRPRWSWEVFPGTNEAHQYVDGGLMDNFPLDVVAQFLLQAAEADLIQKRPKWNGKSCPHLLFSASLEVDARDLSQERWDLSSDWPALWRRARKLGYNKKLEFYQQCERGLRDIYEAPGDEKKWEPLDLELVTVRPRWLCGTFAFHPMIGFRQANQAASIAHGCASTLLQFSALREDTPHYLAGWGIDESHLSPSSSFEEANRARKEIPDGKCWLRPNTDCPFSRKKLLALKGQNSLPEHTVTALTEIYRACKRPETHEFR